VERSARGCSRERSFSVTQVDEPMRRGRGLDTGGHVVTPVGEHADRPLHPPCQWSSDSSHLAVTNVPSWWSFFSARWRPRFSPPARTERMGSAKWLAPLTAGCQGRARSRLGPRGRYCAGCDCRVVRADPPAHRSWPATIGPSRSPGRLSYVSRHFAFLPPLRLRPTDEPVTTLAVVTSRHAHPPGAMAVTGSVVLVVVHERFT
jgi:hypothetical protein